MSILRALGLGVLALVLLLAGGYVVRGLVGAAEVARTKDRVVEDLTQQLPGASRESGREMATLRRALTVPGVIDADGGAPSYSWRELDCGFSSNDAGWIVQSYEQECEVRSIELYAVASAVAGDPCHTVTLPGADVGRVVRATTSALTSTERDWSCPSDLVADDDTATADRSRFLAGTRPDDLTSSPSWVVAETRSERIVTDIGCSPWGLIFCSRPYDVPLTGS